MARDYYDVLEVERTASEGEIKKSFRRLARQLHPDVNNHDPDAEEKFKEAAEAYEVLSDSERRRTYDSYGAEGLRSGGWHPRTEDFSSIQDIFQNFFGGDGFGEQFGFGRGGPAPGGDIGAVVEVTLEEVLKGSKREVVFEAVSVCEHCRGNGAEPGTPINTCERCEGSGQLREVTRSVFGQVMRAVPCEACGGAGKVPEQPCEVCDGVGRTSAERAWEVDVPEGIEDGQRIRISGAGHAGEPGGGPGDLYVEVRLAPDERFERQGTELVTKLQVSATAAMLGEEATVPTLEGDEPIEVPAGTQPGDLAVLEGMGLPPLRGGRRGNLHVVFQVVIPPELDDEQRALVGRLHESLRAETARRSP